MSSTSSGKLKFTAALACATLACLQLPVAAFGAGTQVIADCNANNGLTQEYPAAVLRDALRNLPSDIDEYSDCRSIISAALVQANLKNRKPPDPDKPLSKAAQEKIERSLNKTREEVAAGDVDTKTAGAAVVPGAGRTLQSAVEPGIPGTLAFAIGGIALIGVAEFAARGRRSLALRKSTGEPGN